MTGLLPGDDVKVLGAGTHVRAIDSSGLVVTGERAITLLGVHDIVVVDTGDALLVTTPACAQRVKDAREAWQDEREDLL